MSFQWIDGGTEPDRAGRQLRTHEAAFAAIASGRSVQGPCCLADEARSYDLISGTPVDIHTYFNNAIDIHHVFPRSWCENARLPREKWNSVVNKAQLAARTNRFISGDAPSVYLSRIQKNKQVSSENLDQLPGFACNPHR